MLIKRNFILQLSFFTFIIGGVLFSCQSTDSNPFAALEENATADASEENINALFQAYMDSVQANAGNYKVVKPIYEKLADKGLKYNRYSYALTGLQSLILYDEGPETPDRLVQMIDIFDKIKRGETNQVMYRAFVDEYPNHAMTSTYNERIEDPAISIDSLINYFGVRSFNDSTISINQVHARKFVDACEAFALVKKSDPDAPVYLHKAAEMARSLKSIPKAMSLYDWILEKHPGGQQAADAMFLKAFTLENDLEQYDLARNLYNEYLVKYPNDKFSESAQFLLDNLGKSDEGFLESLKAKSEQVQ